MAAAAILKSVNSNTFEQICTKFDNDTENGVPKHFYHQNS